MNPPRKILVAVPLRIGDVLLATPLIRSLRQAWPQARLEVLVFENTEGILQRNPDIDRVITVPTRPRFWQHLRLVAGLFRRYDLAVTPLLGDRPTLYAWLAGKVSIGMQDGSDKERWKQRLLTKWAFFDRIDTHTVLTSLGIADQLGIPRSHEVVAAWSADDDAIVAGLLPFSPDAQSYAVLHLSPKFRYKMWKDENWVEVARWLETKGIRTVLTGSGAPDEMDYVDGIAGLMPPGTVNMAGKLSLAQSACLISRAKCYVGPDTAMTHVAAALGTSTVALFGPSNPVKWGPWPKGYVDDVNPYRMTGAHQRVNNTILLQGEGDCVPCMEEGCDRHNDSLSACLQNLPTRRVLDALQELMGAN